MRCAWLVSSLMVAFAHGACAQPAGGAGNLDDTQREGLKLTVQHCSLCHTRTNLHSSTTIGPILSRESAGGREDVLRQVIADGTPRMPGFKYQFEPTQIDAIVAYIKTVQPAGAAPH